MCVFQTLDIWNTGLTPGHLLLPPPLLLPPLLLLLLLL
jgi:hypothetical protein